MREVDRMIQAAVKRPKEDAGRGAAADAIRAEGEYDLADAVEGDTGPELLAAAAALGKRAKLPLSLKILWAAYALVPRLEEQPAPPPVAIPVSERPRRVRPLVPERPPVDEEPGLPVVPLPRRRGWVDPYWLGPMLQTRWADSTS